MLSTLGIIALVVGAILVIVGYTLDSRATRPGWGCIVLAVVLILIAYLLPVATTSPHYSG